VPAEAAKLAVDTVFTESKRRTESNPVDILHKALVAANQAVYQLSSGKDYAGLTVVALKDNLVYVGQAGRLTRAYLVRNNSLKSEQIQGTPQGESCLGDTPDNPDILVASKGTIKRGDRIILCSDGLFEPPKDPKHPGLSQEIAAKVEAEIPRVGQYDDIRGAAKHLSSIAKGMDSSDDITVVVLGFGRKQKAFSWKRLLGFAGLVMLLILAVGFSICGVLSETFPSCCDGPRSSFCRQRKAHWM